MQPSSPNENGILPEGSREVVASRGRSRSAIDFAMCQDGLIRYAVELHYSYGGFTLPIWLSTPGYSTLDAARRAALEELLTRWPKWWSSQPVSVRAELDDLRQQIEGRLVQPTLF